MAARERRPVSFLDRLRAQAPIPTDHPDPVESLVALIDSWLEAGQLASRHRFEVQGDSNEVSEYSHLRDLDSRFRAEFERRAERILVRAAPTPNLSLFDDQLESVRRLVTRLRQVNDRWLKDPIDLAHLEENTRKVNEPFRLREELDNELARLRRVGSVLRRDLPQLPILGDVEARVWEALIGVAKNAKELATELNRGDPSSIRKAVNRLRKKQREVREIQGRGFYRPDFPPADIASSPPGKR